MDRLPVFAAAVTGVVFWSNEVSAAEYAPKFVGNAVRICVERLEEQGSLNILPITVNMTDHSGVTLFGGQAGCIYVRAGQQTISLTYAYPYGGQNNQMYWNTPVMSFFLQKGGVASFELCEAADQAVNEPSWRTAGWHDMWLLKRTTEISTRKCAAQAAP